MRCIARYCLTAAGLNLLASLAPCLAQANTTEQHRLNGRVRHADRSGASSVTVVVRWRAAPELPGLVGWTLPADAKDGATPSGVARRVAKTDSAGRWRLDLPVAGPFEIVAATADGKQRSVRTFPVMAGAFVEQVLEPTFYVAGTMRDQSGEPMARAGIRFEPHVQTWTRLALYGLPRTQARVTTDDDGRFVYALDNAYIREPRWEPYLEATPADPQLWFARTPLLQPVSKCREVDLQALPRQVVRGVVRDRAGKGIAGVTVYCWAEPWRSVTSGKDGSFEIAAERQSSLAAKAPGFSISRVPSKKRLPGAACVIEMWPTSKLRVRLVDSDGSPLANRPLLWSFADTWEAPVEQLGSTDADGVAFLEHAPANLTTMGFVKIGGVFSRFARLIASEDTKLEDRSMRVRSVAGMVTNADGEPVPAARLVAIVPADNNRRTAEACTWVTYTDHGGRYRFPSLPQGAVRILCEASHEGFVAADVAAGADRCNLKTGADGVVTLRIVDSDSKPVAMAWVTMTTSGGLDEGVAPSAAHAQTTVVGFANEAGELRFRSLPEARWTVLGHVIRDGALWFGASAANTGDRGVDIVMAEHGR